MNPSWASCAADLSSGSATLRQIGAAPAGGVFEGAIGPGETVRIFTGGRLPTGADAVALQENASVDRSQVSLEGRIDRSPPAFEGHPVFEIVDDRAGRAQSLKIRGKATEALAGVEIDGKAATFSGSCKA